MNWYLDDPVPKIDTIPRWPHQTFAVEAVLNLIGSHTRRILVTTPTGGGKSLSIYDIVRTCIRREWGVVLFANRKLLIEQIERSLEEYGIPYGVRTAEKYRKGHELFQIASIQTEYRRLKAGAWEPHDARVIVVDEAHLNENDSSQYVWGRYQERGAYKVGFTATPLGLDGCYDELVIAGANSELVACGALVKSKHYGCTEPDLRNIGRILVGEDPTEEEDRKLIMVPGIHGRVIDWFRRLNPHGLPSIGFAPGVPESRGFAEAFVAAGIPAAHIDGDFIWINGEEKPSTQERRDAVLKMSRDGEVRIVWNRFVLREAVDMPWLRHGIFATVFGSLQSYVQSGGRLLRAHKDSGKRFVTVQDHGGNWWRHGSLDTDRNWKLTDTNRLLANLRQDALAGDGENPPTEPQPFLCPNCQVALVLRNIMRGSTATCPSCGHRFDFTRRSRPVIQANGELVHYQGNVFTAKKVERRPDTLQHWEKVYWRAYRTGTMTFSQAAGLFYQDHHYFPPRSMALMPYTTAEWYLPVKKVPFQRLRPKEGDDS